MDYFIKSKVLNLDSQTSQIWSSPLLNFRHIKLSTWKMPSRFIASKYSVTWNMYKFQRYDLWTIIYGRCFMPPPNLTLAKSISYCFSESHFASIRPDLFSQPSLVMLIFDAKPWLQVNSIIRIFSFLLLSKQILSTDQSHCPMWKFHNTPLRASPWINSHCTQS